MHCEKASVNSASFCASEPVGDATHAPGLIDVGQIHTAARMLVHETGRCIETPWHCSRPATHTPLHAAQLSSMQ